LSRRIGDLGVGCAWDGDHGRYGGSIASLPVQTKSYTPVEKVGYWRRAYRRGYYGYGYPGYAYPAYPYYGYAYPAYPYYGYGYRPYGYYGYGRGWGY
jgi:hypothetical protein